MADTKTHLVEVRTRKDAAAATEAMDIMASQFTVLDCIGDRSRPRWHRFRSIALRQEHETL